MEIGERVVHLLLREIGAGRGDGAEAEAEIVPHELVIRQSVGPFRGEEQ